ncbi:MAP/microtubule affinity-regulating kinase 4 [Dissophora globulifera]|uniref:MAP/microtubule affinity-regulating kinase 4 n=1 Tax=Dissophora globulifera TaxID=979702 RepID=A0A9P6QXN6_9FUNG|nr:MAP/microtubule affinity-regulating kinase 4 [Dissophora globulifera]
MDYAVKVINKQAHKPEILLRLRREIELMEALDHPNIVKLHEVIETQFTIFVCMEYVEGCTLEQYLKDRKTGKLSEREAGYITRELASAIAHCHANSIVHRDIKPANILISKLGKVKLIDFGLGNIFSYRSRLNTICGSLPYYSPEIARQSDYRGPEIDIWCLGVVLYRMTVGRDPFTGTTKRDVKSRIVNEGFQPPLNLSDGLVNTLRTLLVADGEKRLSFTILDNDPWLYGKDADQEPPFLSENRSISEDSRLSGTTLVRYPSKYNGNDKNSKAWKRQSLAESYYYNYDKSGSLFGGRSMLADALGAGVWHVNKDQPRFRKNRIRISPCARIAQNDLLFQRDIDLSLLQFLLPILRACQVSYYIHSTSRILCGTSLTRTESNSVMQSQLSAAWQKMVLHASTPMIVSNGSSDETENQCSTSRCGVFSIDIVKSKKNGSDQHALVIKRLIGSSLTVQYFKAQFLAYASVSR